MESEECTISSEQVSQYLISNGLYLTGLEFLAEGQELGGFDLSCLQRFFSDTSKFPPEEVQRFQGEDVLSSILMAKEREQKLCLAEYELRVATEDLKRSKDYKEQDYRNSDGGYTPLHSPAMFSHISHEDCRDIEQRRHLNSVVMAYLMQSGYKVTALTFQEEALHDFQNTQPPGDTLANYYHLASQATPKKSNTGHMPFDGNDMQGLLTADDEIIEDKKGSETPKQKINGRESPESATINELPLTDGDNESESVTSSKVHQTVKTTTTYAPSTDVLSVLMESLPKIIPNVLIKRRSECIPVLSTLIRDHPDATCRQALLEMLFGLIKHPDDYQRNEIVVGIGLLAGTLQGERITQEIIPHCCELANHKSAEKRLLIAEVIGVISHHVDDDIRSSLLLSLLQQLSTDTDASVRYAALAGLLSCIKAADISTRKHQTVVDLLVCFVTDSDDYVSKTALTEFAPLLSKSQCGLQLSLTFIQRIFEDILRILDASPSPSKSDKNSNDRVSDRTCLPKPTQQKRIQSLLNLLNGLLPDIAELCNVQLPFHVVNNLRKSESEDPLTPVADMKQNSLDRNNNSGERRAIAFDQWFDEEEEEGTDVRFLLTEIVPLLIACLSRIAPCCECYKLRERFATTTKAMCKAFEWCIVEGGLRLLFLSASGICASSSAVSSLSSSQKITKLLIRRQPQPHDATCIFPIYLSAVMESDAKERFRNFIASLFECAPENESPWGIENKQELLAAIVFAGGGSVYEMLISVVEELCLSADVSKRCGAVIIAEGLATHASHQDVLEHIAPNVLQLAKDSEIQVRLHAISALKQISIVYPNSTELSTEIYPVIEQIMTTDQSQAKIKALNDFSAAASICSVHTSFVLKQIPAFLNELCEANPDANASHLTETATAVFASLLALDSVELVNSGLLEQLISCIETLAYDASASAYLDNAQRQILAAMFVDQTAKRGIPKKRLLQFSKTGKKKSVSSDFSCHGDS